MVDGEPFDTRVDLDGRIRTWSLFATNTVSVGDKWSVTMAGRFNRTSVRNRDNIQPGGGPGSLDGDHVFQRFNPAVGVTFNPSGSKLYFGTQASSVDQPCLFEVDTATLLPPDDSAFGFDNVADVLGVSPSLQERYLAAATRISALAIGDVGIRPGSETYRVRQDLSQNQHIDGLPPGTIGVDQVDRALVIEGYLVAIG